MEYKKSMPQSTLKINNKKDILKYILTKGETSRADLASALGSTKTTISKNANELLAENIIIETGKGNNQVGKKSTLLDINPSLYNFFVINLSGNMFNLSVFNLKNERLYNLEIGVPNKNEIYSILELAIKQTNSQEILNTCILTIPAVVKGTSITSNNEVYRESFEKVHSFCEENGIKLIVENDIDLLAEYIYASNVEISDFILIGANYGIGSSTFVDGRLLKGKNNFAGEIGFNNPICTEKGIENLESRCSIRGMINSYYELTGEKLSIESLFEEIKSNNATINEYIDNMIVELAVTIINMANIFDIRHVILSGTLFEIKEDVVGRIEKYISPLLIENIQIVKSEYSAKSIDGALLVMRRELQNLV